MYFQKVLKGIANIDHVVAESIAKKTGIESNWLRKRGRVCSSEIQQQLTEPMLLAHLNMYDDPLPSAHPMAGMPSTTTYGDVSPFISTTAGAVQRDASQSLNIFFDPFFTALKFATRNLTTQGFVFYAYVFTLGKKAVPLSGFAEEVRELNIYRDYLPYHHEGEIAAKINIPSIQIEKAEEYDGKDVLESLKKGNYPVPIRTIDNKGHYEAPDRYSNIREVL